MFSYTIFFIYLSLLSTLYPFRVLYFILSIYCIHVLFIYYFIYLYSCTVHFLYCFPVILFIWLSLSCTCICCHIFSYDIHILCFSYIILFHILYFSYAFRILCFSYTILVHILFMYYVLFIYFHIVNFHMLLYYISCSCNCTLSSHSSVMLLISYHILFTFPVHILFIFFYVHASEYLRSGYWK